VGELHDGEEGVGVDVVAGLRRQGPLRDDHHGVRAGGVGAGEVGLLSPALEEVKAGVRGQGLLGARRGGR